MYTLKNCKTYYLDSYDSDIVPQPCVCRWLPGNWKIRQMKIQRKLQYLILCKNPQPTRRSAFWRQRKHKRHLHVHFCINCSLGHLKMKNTTIKTTKSGTNQIIDVFRRLFLRWNVDEEGRRRGIWQGTPKERRLKRRRKRR